MDEQYRLLSLKKFRDHRAMAKHRGIEFNLTHEEWWDIWQKSGKWNERGIKCGQFVMSRKNDIGAYEIGNVFIQTQNENLKEANLGRKHSQAHIAKVRRATINTWEKRKQIKEPVHG